MLDASPPAAPASDADEVRRECGMEIAEASAAVENHPAAALAAVEAKMGEAGEGVAAEQEHVVAPLVSEAKMEADEGSAADEERAAAPVASEVKMEVSEGSILDKEQDAAAPVAGEAKMEVDESSVQEQEHTVAAVASEVKMEEGEGRVADQHPTTPAGASQAKENEGEFLVGRYISRSAAGHGRIHLGKVSSYDSSTGMYTVVFEDGQGEDLGLPQLCELLMAEENGASGMKVRCRKRKLDLLVSSGSATEVKGPPSARQRVDPCEMSARPDVPQQSGSGSDVSEDAESSSNSSDSTKELPAETCPPPLVQGPELPPSSGDIAVPEESISYLFSVYNFLRSFSVQLFVSPFGLDDFVASINCTVQNTLLDAVHVSLLRALKRHLETKSSEGSELASNCLKYLDWALLDALTWPAFLLEYLYVMGCIKNLEGQSFGRSLLAIEYYELPVTMKLKVLQILCDHVIDSEELKTELEAREGYNEEMEYEIDSSSIFSEAGLRAVLTRASKASACKKIEDLQNFETAPNVDFSLEINRLQKEILVLQTEKEFIKSSYESGIAKYWDLEKKINDMQEDVCYFQKEVPYAKSTICNVELEPVDTTKQSNILHMPLKTEDGKDLCQWVSRFDIYEESAFDASSDLISHDVYEPSGDHAIDSDRPHMSYVQTKFPRSQSAEFQNNSSSDLEGSVDSEILGPRCRSDLCSMGDDKVDYLSGDETHHSKSNLDAHCAGPSPDVYEALHYEENASVGRFDAAKGGQRSTQ